MRRDHRQLLGAVMSRRLAALSLLLALSACGRSPEAARKKLVEDGIPFTPGEFVRRAGADPWSTLELFLRGGMDPNMKADVDRMLEGVTALMVASRSGRDDVVQRLREAGAEVNAQTRQGHTALMYAASQCRPDTVRLLLVSGAEVNHANRAGETALMWAIPATWPAVAPSCAADCVNQLLAAGARINERSHDGSTALHESIGRRQLSLLRLLLLRRADPNLRGGQLNFSPLKHAIRGDELEMVRALLVAGADPNEPALLEWESGTARGNAVRSVLLRAAASGKKALVAP